MVVVRQRLYGELAADLRFNDFPFDDQVFPISVVSYAVDADELVFSSASRLIGEGTVPQTFPDTVFFGGLLIAVLPFVRATLRLLRC